MQSIITTTSGNVVTYLVICVVLPPSFSSVDPQSFSFHPQNAAIPAQISQHLSLLLVVLLLPWRQLTTVCWLQHSVDKVKQIIINYWWFNTVRPPRPALCCNILWSSWVYTLSNFVLPRFHILMSIYWLLAWWSMQSTGHHMTSYLISKLDRVHA